MSKKTLIIGASTDSSRYSFLAANRLKKYGHEIRLLGRSEGEIQGQKIETEKKKFRDIDTISMYVSPKHQAEFYDYVLALNPKRVIFNPGTENPEFEEILKKHNIEATDACTLVMLSTGQF